MSEKQKQSTIGIIKREDGRYLCVWNKRYGGWGFPGGLVEESDSSFISALARELWEETSIAVEMAEMIYCGPHKTKEDIADKMVRDVIGDGPGPYRKSGSVILVFRVGKYEGTPKENEVGCAVTWFTKEEFLKWSPFKEFYEPLFKEGMI